MRARCGGGWRARATAALAVALLAPAAIARPFDVEDLLRREAIGQVFVTPGDRWLVIERRRAYVRAARFDFEKYNDVWRTRICRVDLQHPGPCRDVLRADDRAGYMAGPASPDGARLAVYRVSTSGAVQLGVMTLADGQLRWFAVGPDLALFERTIQWISPSRLLVIAEAPGVSPFNMRWGRPQADLPRRWALTARGQSAMTVVGSGRVLDARPHDPPRRLLEVDVRAGRVRDLAQGAFADLEVAPSGRRVAVFSDAQDIPLSADHAVQGAYGVATHRRRLQLLDLTDGRLSPPLPWDLLGRLVRWSADDRLLVFARRDGEPWSEGRLLVVDGASGVAAPPDTHGVVPEIRGRPETVRADWLGGAVVVFGQWDSGRPGWYRIGPHDAIDLTAALPEAPRDDVSLTADGLLAVSKGRAWRAAASGATELAAEALTPFRPPTTGFRDRTSYALVRDRLDAVDTSSSKPALVRIMAHGGVLRLSMGRPGRLLAVPTGRFAGLVRSPLRGGAEALFWVSPECAPVRVLTLNAHFADIDLPTLRPVRHQGPAGEPLTSWLLLPPHAAGGPPPPLVVYPYLGATYPTSPSLADPRTDNLHVEPALLAGHGYAVLMPSLPVPAGADPTAGLADRILDIIAAAHATPGLETAFDPARLALWGESYGGYTTLATLTQTPRFRAAIAEAAPSDLFSIEGTFDTNRRVWPQDGVATPWTAGWTEDLQGGMGGPPWRDPYRYLRSSPALAADRISTPLLLIHGDQDGIPLEQAEEMFSSLFRQNRDAELVTYWGEGHTVRSPGNIRDLYWRAFEWLDRVLGLGRDKGKSVP